MCMHSAPVIGENSVMARTPTLVAGLRKVDLPEARQAIPALHAYLRECVLDGTLVPGTKLSQVALAEQLGVSRTPLREVLRMLQEEGLVEIEPNQRTRVAGLDPQELDDVYASRILLETLALSMTLEEFTPARQRETRRMLTAMRQAARTGDFGTWFSSHAEFHRLITAGAGAALQRQLTAFADRTIRYIRIYQLSEPTSWQSAGETEHAAILTALTEHDDEAALTGLAHHLARTAERVLTDCAPDYDVNAVSHAVSLVEGGAGKTVS
jgi:DNA-binding GntR family transcriptional regulator